jgi:hypothetical protein
MESKRPPTSLTRSRPARPTARGEPGSETWIGNAIEVGGGATWLTGSYDPETQLLLWPTGNPFPDTDGTERKGDNLYTNSVVALDVVAEERQEHLVRLDGQRPHGADLGQARGAPELPHVVRLPRWAVQGQAHAEGGGEFADRRLAVGQSGQDGPPCWVGQGGQRCAESVVLHRGQRPCFTRWSINHMVNYAANSRNLYITARWRNHEM